MTHTPGPWAVKHLHGLKADAFNITAHNGEWTICMGPNWFPEHAEENSANANLIAAAPELFAFAEYVLEMDPESDAPLFAKARAALAKARGQS